MVHREFWEQALLRQWKQRSIVWLSGVRRAGKTTLARAIPGVEYFDCELPSVRQALADPELFFSAHRRRRIVLDEVHRLPRPSEVLKIAADHFADVRIVATGSSILGASTAFRDTLVGRKTTLWLTPMISDDVAAFGGSLESRMLRGGLPPFFLEQSASPSLYQEWIDGFFAKDILQLFRLERHASFLRFLELVFLQSGGIFEAVKLAKLCEISHTTVRHYLNILAATHVAHILRPFSSRRKSEIISAPKVYGFDTGFLCYFRGIRTLRPDDAGICWEHIVLNEIHARLQTRAVHYWRDKRGHEVDVVLVPRGGHPLAIECKWQTHEDFGPRSGLAVFLRQYPLASACIVTPHVPTPHNVRIGAHAVPVLDLAGLAARLDPQQAWM